MTMNRMTTGTMAMTDDANRYCHATRYWPMKVVMPTVSGLISGDCASVSATTNSFHAAMNVKMTAVTMPGRASGRVTRRRTPSREAPSMDAASSSSTGMVEKYATMIQVENARLNAALTTMSARYVSGATAGTTS